MKFRNRTLCCIGILMGTVLAGGCAAGRAADKKAGCELLAPAANTAKSPTGMFAAPSGAPEPLAEGPLRLSVSEAVLGALERNAAFRVQRFAPAMVRTAEEVQRAQFDPRLQGTVSGSRVRSPGATGGFNTADSADLSLGAERTLTDGTVLGLDLGIGLGDSGDDVTRLGLSATRPMLRGGSRAFVLASLREAELATSMSVYELRGAAEALLDQTEEAYWSVVLAKQRIVITEQSLGLAERQLEEVGERIRVGQMAEIEEIVGQSELALRREALIVARGDYEAARLKLLRLMAPGGTDPWNRELVLEEEPTAPPPLGGRVEDHVATALKSRPDLNQARLEYRRGTLEVARTRNGLLPRLDFFVTLGTSGYASSYGGGGDLGEGYDAKVGITAAWTVGNREARAVHERAVLGERQSLEALANLAGLAELEVRTSWVALASQVERVAATAATRRLQEEKLRAETEKFRVGRSTSILVAQAQRDLLSAQIAEIDALVQVRTALARLRLNEGSLLSAYGIEAPGADPVTLDGQP